MLKINSQNQDYGVYIGNFASTGAFYVRKEGSEEVFIAKSNLKQNLTVNINFWRDKRIADLNSEDITKIEYAGKRNFSLEKAGDIWQYKWSWRSEDLTLEEADKFKNLFSPMITSSFADEEETASRYSISEWWLGGRSSCEPPRTSPCTPRLRASCEAPRWSSRWPTMHRARRGSAIIGSSEAAA